MNEKTKILIVDDKPENLVELEVALRDLNIELIKASSGSEALIQTHGHDFALAILAVKMSEMDGYELAERFRNEEKTSRLPFIFISAEYTSNLNIFKGYEKGAFSFITKPFQPEILKNTVNFFVEKNEQEIKLLQMSKKLEYSNRELESFSYSISHDLRAPLRALDGYSKIMEENYTKVLDEEGKRLLGRIKSNAKKMGALLDGLLDLSKLGRTEVHISTINMQELVVSVLNDIKNLHPNHSKICIKNLLTVNADRSLLYQVWLNLISNAVKFSLKTENNQIEIGSTQTDDAIIYYVKDNGVGFNMDYAPKLFGVFQRLHSVQEYEGIGIGLAIVHRIITKLGGKVWAQASLNEGATFYFSLPTP